MNPETPFHLNKRRRAGLIRRVGNIASGLSTQDNELVAWNSELQQSPPELHSYLKYIIACHLEFISPLSTRQATHLGRSLGIQAELANVRSTDFRYKRPPEIIGAAFTDAAALVKRSLE